MPTYENLPAWPRHIPIGATEADVVDRRDDIAIGKVVFVRDENTRIYLGRGREAQGPIERYYYVARLVVGKTRVSWLIGSAAAKVPFRDPSSVYGRLDVEDDLWLRQHRYQVAKAVERIKELDKLREIARLVGYSPREQD